MKIKLIIITMLSMVSCYQKRTMSEKEFLDKHQFVKSINGDVIYVYDDKNEVVSVFKPEFFDDHKLFRVGINRDTIILGDEFNGEVYSFSSKLKMRVHLKEPFIKSYEKNDGSRVAAEITFKPLTAGEHLFAGIVEFDSTKEAFEYKFIVLSKE